MATTKLAEYDLSEVALPEGWDEAVRAEALEHLAVRAYMLEKAGAWASTGDPSPIPTGTFFTGASDSEWAGIYADGSCWVHSNGIDSVWADYLGYVDDLRAARDYWLAFGAGHIQAEAALAEIDAVIDACMAAGTAA